jgi:hypothetical protein
MGSEMNCGGDYCNSLSISCNLVSYVIAENMGWTD